MKVYISKGDGRWQYGEREVVEKETGRPYTLTQPAYLFKEDYYSIKRTIACANFACTREEDNLCVYEVSYLENGCSLITVDEETVQRLISSHVDRFVRGDALDCIVHFFEENKAACAEVSKMVTISTGHITEETAEQLGESVVAPLGFQLDVPIDIICYCKDMYGWFVHIPENIEEKDYPCDLKECLCYARDLGCEWLCFDRDGERVDGLSYYEW